MGALLFLFPAASQCLEEGLTPEWRPLSMVWALMGSCTWSSYSGAWPTAGLQKPWPIWMKKPYEEESPSRNCWVQQKNLYRKLGLHRFVSWIVPWVFVLFILIKLQFYVFWPKYVKARQLVAASKIQNYCSMISLPFALRPVGPSTTDPGFHERSQSWAYTHVSGLQHNHRGSWFVPTQMLH